MLINQSEKFLAYTEVYCFVPGGVVPKYFSFACSVFVGAWFVFKCVFEFAFV